MHEDTTTPDEPIADADLILRTRSGDTEAFGELWRRHYPSGITVARSITSSIDADDLVQESYTRIYQAIIKGGGPNGSFRAYLFTSIRNTAAAWGRARRDTAIDELDTVADPDSTEHASNEALDRGLTAQAFRSLPTRWQEVLWYTEIEQMKPAEVGPLLGMKSGAVSQLAFRAREGLREAWIQAHLRNAAPGSECQWTIEHLGAYSRGNLSARDHKRLETHLDECARCMIVSAEAKDVSQRLALVLLPLVLGVTGTAAYLATLQGGGTPIVALAAMPSTVFEGGVVVGATGGAASGLAASTPGGGAGGGAAAGGTAGGTAGTSGGVLTGVGALVGAGSATLVVAGVIAAAAIVPGLLTASSATSLATASESDSSTITTEVGPDEHLDSLEDQPLVIEVPEEAEKPEEITQPDDLVPDVPPADASAPVTSPAPAVPSTPAAPVPPATPGPTEPEEENPGEGEEPPVEEEPPGEEQPGEEEPPEEEEPGEEEPGETLPEGAPTWSPGWLEVDEELVTRIFIPVSGEPGASVRVQLDGRGGGQVVLDEDGNGTAEVRPTLLQILFGATVSFAYVLGDEVGEITTAELADVVSGTEELSATDAGPGAARLTQTSTEPTPTGEDRPSEEALADESDEPAAEPEATEQPIPVEEAPAPEEPEPTEAPADDAAIDITEGTIEDPLEAEPEEAATTDADSDITSEGTDESTGTAE